MAGNLEQCANCDAIIGRLETPFIWRDEIVCAACHRKLSDATASKPPPLKPEELGPEDIVRSVISPYDKSDWERMKGPSTSDEILFREDRVEVTRTQVRWPGGSLPLAQVLTLASRTPFFWNGYNVEITDLVERRYTVKLRNKDSAARFIGAIKSANGSVNIDRESMSWFFIWEA